MLPGFDVCLGSFGDFFEFVSAGYTFVLLVNLDTREDFAFVFAVKVLPHTKHGPRRGPRRQFLFTGDCIEDFVHVVVVAVGAVGWWDSAVYVGNVISGSAGNWAILFFRARFHLRDQSQIGMCVRVF